MFTRILVPTDFSAHSDAALEYARALAARFGASMHLLHVIGDPLVPTVIGAVPEMYFGPEAPATRMVLLEEARARLARRLTHADRQSHHATSEVLFGSPAYTIAEYADVNGYDLIVMGTHGRTGLAHVLMGSVAEKVVRTASCPVLTVRGAVEPRLAGADRACATVA